MPDCEHQYAHIETKKWCDSSGGYNLHWCRTERFFCTRCLDIREVKQDEWSREAPDWYR